MDPIQARNQNAGVDAAGLSQPQLDPAVLAQAIAVATQMVAVDATQQWDDDTLVEEFLKVKGRNSENTRAAYERDLNHYRSFLLLIYKENIGLAPGDGSAVADYEAFLREQVTLGELAPSTANRRMNGLSSFYTWASKAKLRTKTGIWSNPVDFESYKLKSNFSERALTEAQVLRLIDAAANPGNRRVRNPQRDAALIQFLYHTGARVSEAAALQWQHLQATETGGIVHFFGKGGKERWVAISPEVWNKLQSLPGDHDRAAPVFKSERGGPMNRDTMADIVARCGRAIGVEDVTPHVLRHTHATHAIRRGVSPDLVKQTLGHSSLAVTSNYLKANPTDSSGLHLVA